DSCVSPPSLHDALPISSATVRRWAYSRSPISSFRTAVSSSVFGLGAVTSTNSCMLSTVTSSVSASGGRLTGGAAEIGGAPGVELARGWPARGGRVRVLPYHALGCAIG